MLTGRKEEEEEEEEEAFIPITSSQTEEYKHNVQ
jgi:hypothetical protein